MEFHQDHVKEFLTEKQLGQPDVFSQTFLGRIPTNNCYGLEQMDVKIKVSHHRGGNHSTNVDLKMQYNNELKLCHLRHKNIVRLIGFCETSDHLYLVYELFHNITLLDVILDLRWDQCLKILKGVSSGIAYLHDLSNGPLIHSNISLSTILVTEDYVPKIIGFGHCVMEGERRTGGLPSYYPPERGGTATKKADMFAFGILAVQLIARDSRTAFLVQQGESVRPRHILDRYIPVFRERGNIAHPCYAGAKDARKVSELIIGCLERDAIPDMKGFYNNLVLLSFARQL